MKIVRDIMEERQKEICSIAPDALVFDALKLMAQRNIGALLVVEGGRIVGIMTERDYARKVIIHGRSSKSTTVRDIMTPRVCVVEPHNTIEECMALMTRKQIRHLPVMESGRAIGIISIRDVVRAVIAEKDFNLDALVKVIAGSEGEEE